MTIEKFLDKLRQIDGWFLFGGVLIRNKHQIANVGYFSCPICTLLYVEQGIFKANSLYQEAAACLSLFDAHKIVNAVDNINTHYPELRAQLLEACQLTETL